MSPLDLAWSSRIWCRSAAALGAILLGSACSLSWPYESHYAPLTDGRARVVWLGGKLVVSLSGDDLASFCDAEASVSLGLRWLRPSADTTASAGGWPNAYWTPRYYRDEALASSDSENAIRLRPARFSPQPISPPSSNSVPESVKQPPVSNPVDLWQVGLDTLPFAGFHALLPWFGVAVPLFLGPHPQTSTSYNIDLMNAYNDLMRTPGTSCAFEALVGSAR